MKTSGIGGQAVIEGVMMRNGGKYAVAVRKPDGEIVVENKTCKNAADRPLFFRLPIIRGVVAFIDSLTIGMSTLTFSSSFYEDEEPSEFEKKLDKMTKGHASGVINTLTVILSIILAMVIFVILPWGLKTLLGKVVKQNWILALFEGIIRVVIFVVYILLISTLEDIKRMFMYHGAEHKCINCIESGKALTVKNVRASSKEHRRCGTSFMLNVMILSIIFFMVIRVNNPLLQLGLRLLLIPVIAGISYEFIRLAGRKDNLFTKIISRPGMLMQALTTKEPDDEMIEVGIKSVEAVFDWLPFIEEINNEKKEEKKQEKAAEKPAKADKKAEVKKEDKKAEVKKEDKKAEAKKDAKKADKKKEEKPADKKIEKADVKAAEAKEDKAQNAAEAKVENKAEDTEVKAEAKTEVPEIDLSSLFDIKLSAPEETKTQKASKLIKKVKPEAAPTLIQPARDSDELLAALDFMFEYNGPKTEIEITDEEGVVVTKTEDKHDA